MNLPTSAQVLAATRHLASLVAGAVLMFGISTKISPEQVTAIITSAGNVVNDIVILIGIVAPIVSAYFASRSASPQAQIASVAANPDVTKIVTTPAVASAIPSDKVVSQP